MKPTIGNEDDDAGDGDVGLKQGLQLVPLPFDLCVDSVRSWPAMEDDVAFECREPDQCFTSTTMMLAGSTVTRSMFSCPTSTSHTSSPPIRRMTRWTTLAARFSPRSPTSQERASGSTSGA